MPLSTSIEVDRPPAEVYAYVTDPSLFPQWQDGVVEAHMLGDGPPATGDRCVMTRRIGLMQRAVTSEVTHVDPPRTWGVRGIDGPIRAAVDVTVEALDGGRRSRLTVDIEFTGHGIGRIVVPLIVQGESRREMPENLARLKRRLEGGGQGTAP